MAILLGDIGGTNARFAVSKGTDLSEAHTLKTGDFPTPQAAIADVLVQTGWEPDSLRLCVAGPVADGQAQLTNAGWEIAASAFDWPTRVINDFEALAYAAPHLAPLDLELIKPGQALEEAPKLVLGPGTGLGASLLVSTPAGPQAVATEAGHISLAPTSGLELRLLQRLYDGASHISAEDVLSGTGLPRLYKAVAAEFGYAAPQEGAAAIVDAALNASDPAAIDTLNVFLSWLGGVAGSLALATGARGGVWLAGGILPRLAEQLIRSGFAGSFTRKGRFSDYVREIPVWLITREQPALVGLQHLPE